MSSLPQKSFYTIGDVSRITGTKPHVLRYWESQFKLLRPARRYSGHRKYTQRDIELVNRIRFLILERKYTLAGAKREIHRLFAGARAATGPAAAAAVPDQAVASTAPLLREIKKEVETCLDILGPDEKQLDLLSSLRGGAN